MAVRRLLSGRRSDNWKICLECGNRFRPSHGFKRERWCSFQCEDATMRHGRDQIASWMSRRTFLR